MRCIINAIFAFMVVIIAAAPASGQPFDLQISARSDGNPKPAIIGVTNLPDGTGLMVTLRRPQAKFMAQATPTVLNGAFTAGPFSAKGEPVPPGDYEVEISLPLAANQPPGVRAIVGQNNEFLRGTLVKKSAFGITAEKTFKTNIGGVASKSADTASRVRFDADMKAWKADACANLERMTRGYKSSASCLADLEKP